MEVAPRVGVWIEMSFGFEAEIFGLKGLLLFTEHRLKYY